jgi:hypothetical protein
MDVQVQVNRLTTQVATMQAVQALNHEQNRKSIDDLREGQQRYIAALSSGFANMAESMEKGMQLIKKDIFDLQMWKSKTTGYVLGISAASAAVFAIVEKLVMEGLKK